MISVHPYVIYGIIMHDKRFQTSEREYIQGLRHSWGIIGKERKIHIGYDIIIKQNKAITF